MLKGFLKTKNSSRKKSRSSPSGRRSKKRTKKNRNVNKIITGPPELESEDPRDYKYGGYHPVKIGDLYCDNYVVVGKLGWGHFSTVWLCYDLDYDEFVALKIVRSAKEYTESAKDEIRLCSALSSCQGCIQLFDKFVIKGINGKHVCMVFELAGDNLLSLMRKYQKRRTPMPFELIKQICRDVLTGLYEMEMRGLIHTDIKPGTTQHVKNLVREYIRPKSRSSHSSHGRSSRKKVRRPKINPLKIKEKVYNDTFVVKLADFGNACWVDKHFSSMIQTLQYRAPEVILGQDLWSFACCIFELVTFDFMFDPKGKKGEYSTSEDHLAQMMEILGEIPKSLAMRGKNSYFDDDGNLKHIFKLKFWDLESVLVEKYRIDEQESEFLADFLLQMLNFDPKKRSLPEKLLLHPWLRDEIEEEVVRESTSDYKSEYYKYYNDFY